MANSRVETSSAVEVQNAGGGVITNAAQVLRFLGAGVSVAQVGNETQVTVSGGGGGVTGTPGRVPFFDAGGNLVTSNLCPGYLLTGLQRTFDLSNDDPAIPGNFSGCIKLGSYAAGVASSPYNNSFLGGLGVATLTTGANSPVLASLVLANANFTFGANSPISFGIIRVGANGFTRSLVLPTGFTQNWVHPDISTSFDLTMSMNPGEPSVSPSFVTYKNASPGNFRVPIAGLILSGSWDVNNYTRANSSGTIIALGQGQIDSSGAAVNNSSFIAVGRGIRVGNNMTRVVVYGESITRQLAPSTFADHDTFVAFGANLIDGNYNSVTKILLGAYNDETEANCVAQFGIGISAGAKFNAWVVKSGSYSTFEPKTFGLNVEVITPAASAIQATRSCVDFDNAGAIVTTGIGVGAGRTDGQELTLRQIGAGTTEIPSGSGCQLSGGVPVVLTQYSTITLTYSATLALWLEKGRSIV